jgi:hypothetical protein
VRPAGQRRSPQRPGRDEEPGRPRPARWSVNGERDAPPHGRWDCPRGSRADTGSDHHTDPQQRSAGDRSRCEPDRTFPRGAPFGHAAPTGDAGRLAPDRTEGHNDLRGRCGGHRHLSDRCSAGEAGAPGAREGRSACAATRHGVPPLARCAITGCGISLSAGRVSSNRPAVRRRSRSMSGGCAWKRSRPRRDLVVGPLVAERQPHRDARPAGVPVE